VERQIDNDVDTPRRYGVRGNIRTIIGSVSIIVRDEAVNMT